MPQFVADFLVKLHDQITVFQKFAADKPIICQLSELTMEQCLLIVAILAGVALLLLTLFIVWATACLPKRIRKHRVKAFFQIGDLSRFKVKRMGKAGSKYYYAEGVNSFQLELPKWKHADTYGNKESGKLFNKIIRNESTLWLHMRNKVYVLTTKDPWEMVYLVHELRESSVDIVACKQEMDKQEQIESSKPTVDEFIQATIAQLNGDEEKFAERCRTRLEAEGMQVMEAPKNRHGINFFVKRGSVPYLVKCQLVPYKHLSSLEELKEFREAADDLFTDNCMLITTGHITIAAAGYAREKNIEVICTEQFMKLMDETEKMDPTKAYLQWELQARDINALIPDDLLAKVLS